jgi:TM2 domain-containing membrane protein YozV
MKQCNRCGAPTNNSAAFCQNCGAPLDAHEYSRNFQNYDANNPFDSCGPEGKSRGVCALLTIFLGGLGVQYFYVGKTTAGILSIIFTLCTCGVWEIIPLIQGILMLTSMTNQQFRSKFVLNTATFPVF